MSPRGYGLGVLNLVLGAAYLAAAHAGVRGTWALDRAIRDASLPDGLPPISEALSGFVEAVLVSAGYLPLYVGASVVFLAVVLSCLHGWIEADDQGGRDLLSPLGALLALGGYGLVLYGLAGPT